MKNDTKVATGTSVVLALASLALNTLSKLETNEWQAFFDGFSKALGGKQAEIEVGSLALGHQTEAKWLPLSGITYDPKDDLFEAALEGLDHMIRKPRKIYIESGAGVLESMEIIDADGVKQVCTIQPERQPRTSADWFLGGGASSIASRIHAASPPATIS